MITLEEAYKNSNDRQVKYLDAIQNKPTHNIFRIASTLRADSISKFLYYFFLKKNIEKSKQALYLSQKLLEFLNKKENNKYFPTQINKFLFICSDSSEVIENFKNFKIDNIPNLDYRLEQGHTLGFVVQQILKCNHEKALHYLDIYKKKHKSHSLKKYDIGILEAIINNDKIKIEELLKFYMLPKNHAMTPDKGTPSHNLLSYESTVYAKIAWIKGIEISIKHPLLPKELLPIVPNKEYLIEYDFLKPDYNPNYNEKKAKGIFGKWFK